VTEKQMETKLADLERRIQRYEDRHEIEMLMGRYDLNHNQKNMHKTIQFYALKQPDVSVEIADRGCYVGEENVRKLFESNYQIQINNGSYLMHWLCSPMIEVAGDGKTAKGVWLAPGAEVVVQKDGEGQAVWNFIRWAIDFIKEDGEWKFWHYRVFCDIKCDYEKGWCKDFFKWNYMGKMPGATDDAPIYHNPVSPTFIQEAIPACPQPYETWTDESWIFANEPQMYHPKNSK